MYKEKFFTIELLAEVLQEYQWPAAYTLEKTPFANVRVRFPGCTLIISEEYESEMEAYFVNSELDRPDVKGPLTIFDAVDVLRAAKKKLPGFEEPRGLKPYLDIEPSVKKVIDGLRNICILLQAYLLPCMIEGDFSWLEEYNRKFPYHHE